MHCNIQELLDSESVLDPDHNTAIFYSITSSQTGLSGIDLGNLLIKTAVAELSSRNPAIKTWCTLSPIPKFASWLQTEMNSIRLQLEKANDRSVMNGLFMPEEMEMLFKTLASTDTLSLLNALEVSLTFPFNDSIHCTDSSQMTNRIQNALYEKNEFKSEWKDMLMRLASHYLLKERRRMMAFDPVGKLLFFPI